MAIAEVSVVPIGTAGTSVSSFVAGALQVLEESGLTYQLTPMGTIIEGDIGEILDVIRKMHETPFAKHAQRVYTTVKIDDRRDKVAIQMGDKVALVKKKLE